MAELILALDLPSAREALALLDRLPDASWVKVGPVLFTREGPTLIRELTGRSIQVFLDLKWHDIPNTVAGAVQAAAGLGVSLATVHALGGVGMMQMAVSSGGPTLPLVAVTVLTSHDAGSYAAAVGRASVGVEAEVLRQAENAISSGLQGVVCSGREAASVRARLGPGPWIVVPGIRRPGDDPGDQVRAVDPATAVRDGATHLVVGRPVLQARDPLEVWTLIAEATQ